MFKHSILQAILEVKRRQNLTRKEILSIQEKSFRRLLKNVWKKSSFYREYYLSHGIKKNDLTEIPVNELPLTCKELLMENFDDAVTDKQLKKKKLLDWIQKETDPNKPFSPQYVIVNTSGVSGYTGVFVYDRSAWNLIRAAAMVRVSRSQINPFHRAKVAFHGAARAHLGGPTFMRSAPHLFYDMRVFSSFLSTPEVIRGLNEFQPNQLLGYPSAISTLAENALKGKLKINPKHISVSGDKLTQQMREFIEDAWHAPLTNFYATTEALCIAAQYDKEPCLKVFDDIHKVELLDENFNDVNIGKAGQIVITSLYNEALPLIRYQLRDLAVKGKPMPHCPFGSFEEIIGRVNDALPVMLNTDEEDTLDPVTLAGFFVAGVQKVQFISHNPSNIELLYVAPENRDSDVLSQFNELLTEKKAIQKTNVSARKVEDIPSDPKTGKYVLIVKH